MIIKFHSVWWFGLSQCLTRAFSVLSQDPEIDKSDIDKY